VTASKKEQENNILPRGKQGPRGALLSSSSSSFPTTELEQEYALIVATCRPEEAGKDLKLSQQWFTSGVKLTTTSFQGRPLNGNLFLLRIIDGFVMKLYHICHLNR